MKEEINHPHLRFYMVNVDKNPIKIMSRETYDELNSYEPMQYRPENWERFNKNQLEDFDFFERQLELDGHIPQVDKIAVLNHQDFLDKKSKIESGDGFVKWFG